MTGLSLHAPRMSTPRDAPLRICLNQEDAAAYGTFEVRGLSDELLARLRAQPPGDPDQTRLTLILEPGRVKTGLVAHAQLGRALTPGLRYRLAVGCGFRSAWGAPLCTSFSKTFAVTSAWTTSLLAAHFQMIPPPARTRAALRLRLPLPMDHVLLSTLLRVHDESHQPVVGEVSLQEEETLWHFVPRADWEPGRYTLEVKQRPQQVSQGRGWVWHAAGLGIDERMTLLPSRSKRAGT